jgi:uncharacterized protein
MPRRLESHTIAGPAGALEALLEEPENETPREAAILCHPHPVYGGSMHNRVVYRMAHGLRRAGLAVLRFNFRGVGLSKGEYGHFEGEVEDARAALAWMRARYPDLPFLLAGFSFGARVITRLGCADGGATKLIAAGFPTKNWRAAYLEECRASKVFIQSTNDEYGPREDLEALFARMSGPKKLIWIESQDHFFAGGLEELEERVREAGHFEHSASSDQLPEH